MSNLATLPSGERIGIEAHGSSTAGYRLGIRAHGEVRDGGAVGAFTKPATNLGAFHTTQISNYALGKLGEDIAAGYLHRIEGLEIIERNAHSTVGEIDLIAEGTDELVFVEVKTRRGSTRGALSVNPRKLHRMRRTAEIWLAQRSNYLPARFAVIEIELPRTRGFGFLHYFPEVDSGTR
ncbi:YraN family protein [Corynebacterium spheniscorum]|uniref:UPF0102 protein SAMN05660282_00677 n=1 Tax=Corynebacterium spheniscorum TaxID=185761 RepID=A0A1I2R8I0_9CORY|nr:YraN family protein [Corynebacterium spheniscorum]KAA8722579.1 YraN family protein [Corynebacterium spheniscorum]SFG36760.1 TIGR00252 family protein [Corynebacterium spheniscorum]